MNGQADCETIAWWCGTPYLGGDGKIVDNEAYALTICDCKAIDMMGVSFENHRILPLNDMWRYPT